MKLTIGKLRAVFLALALLLRLGISLSHAAPAQSCSDSHRVVITIREKAMLKLHSAQDSTFTIDIEEDGAAGDQIELVSQMHADDNYLHYTSIVKGKDQTRKITVHIDDAGKIPAGATLTVQPGAIGAGAAVQGDPGVIVDNAINLATAASSANAKDLVSAIKCCATGTGGSDGVRLCYALSIDDDEALGTLAAGEYAVEVTYTLSGSQ